MCSLNQRHTPYIHPLSFIDLQISYLEISDDIIYVHA